MTTTEKIVAALVARGCREIAGATQKYRTFARPGRPGEHYYVGRCGALRAGRTVTGSVSLEGVVPALIAGRR